METWSGSRNYGKLSQLFTSTIYNRYQPPPGYCYDTRMLCTYPPIQDGSNLFDMNVKEWVDLFVSETCEQAESYKTNQIILTMGSDFMYSNAHQWYKNLDKLKKYINEVRFTKLIYRWSCRS